MPVIGRRPLVLATALGVAVASAAVAGYAARAPVPRRPPPAPRTASQVASVSPDAKLAAEFDARVKEYAALHHDAARTLPPLPRDATLDQITERQRTLERLITRARGAAKQGDIFSQDIRAYFRRQLSRVFSGPEGRKLKNSILEEFPRNIKPQVNSRYPDAVPVTTAPPQMLLLLPALPPELEYRFMGEALILLDVPAHLIVDFVHRALPR